MMGDIILFLIIIATSFVSCGKVRMDDRCTKNENALERCQNALDHCELTQEQLGDGYGLESSEKIE